MVFQCHHLVDAHLVASALELGVQEGVHDLAAQTRAHDAPAQAEGVGVVVAAGKLGAEGIAAAAGADAFILLAHIDMPTPVPQHRMTSAQLPSCTALQPLAAKSG